MSDNKGSKCNRRGRIIKKPPKYCTTDSDKPMRNKKKANSNVLKEMTAMFSNSNSEESTDAPSQSSDNECNHSTDSEDNVEMKKGSQKNAQSAQKKETNQDKPITKSDRKKEGNQEKTLQSTSEQQLRHHENNNLNLPDCSEQILQNNYDQGTLQPTTEQQLRRYGNNNLNLPGSAQTSQNNYDQGTLQPLSEQQLRRHGNNNLNLPGSAQTFQNYDQGDDVMRTSNNHSVYDFNSGSVVDTSTVQNNSSRTPTCNKYISPAVTSNNRFYDSSSTSGIYANATSVPPTYTKELYGSGTALVNTHIHPQLYNYRNNNDGHINYNDSENAILNNLKASQESFFKIFEEKMRLFRETQEQYVLKKMDDMQNYYEEKMDDMKTYFNTKLDNMQTNANNDEARPVYSLPEGFPLQNMQQFENFEKDKQKQKELKNYFIWWGNPNTKIALRQYIRNSISDELASHFKWAQKSNKESNEESENEENEPASHRTLYNTQLSKMMFHANESFHKNADENYNQPKSLSINQKLKRSRLPLNPVNLDETENKPPVKKIGWDCWECREYYKSLSLSKEDLQKRKNQCSRHRQKYARPNTPEGFWNPLFPDTSSSD